MDKLNDIFEYTPYQDSFEEEYSRDANELFEHIKLRGLDSIYNEVKKGYLYKTHANFQQEVDGAAALRTEALKDVAIQIFDACYKNDAIKKIVVISANQSNIDNVIGALNCKWPHIVYHSLLQTRRHCVKLKPESKDAWKLEVKSVVKINEDTMQIDLNILSEIICVNYTSAWAKTFEYGYKIQHLEFLRRKYDDMVAGIMADNQEKADFDALQQPVVWGGKTASSDIDWEDF